MRMAFHIQAVEAVTRRRQSIYEKVFSCRDFSATGFCTYKSSLISFLTSSSASLLRSSAILLRLLIRYEMYIKSRITGKITGIEYQKSNSSIYEFLWLITPDNWKRNMVNGTKMAYFHQFREVRNQIPVNNTKVSLVTNACR